MSKAEREYAEKMIRDAVQHGNLADRLAAVEAAVLQLLAQVKP